MNEISKFYSDDSKNAEERTLVRLRVCNLNECEARCCYDGVYLEDGEEARIDEVVASDPEFFKELPTRYIIDGSWADDRVTGRKTAVKPHDYKAADFPSHFTRTRCVFCSDEHKCLLQVLAVERGLHKWAYKPKACWMFPMQLVGGKPAPPPSLEEQDPDCLGEEYPGYAKFVPCGQDRPDGAPWKQTLVEEIAYWHETELSDDDEHPQS